MIWGMIVIKEVSGMKVIGTEREIEWAKHALMNQCNQCPYMEPCNRAAVRDQEDYGEVKHSCLEYLEDNIEFIIDNNI